MGHEIKGRSLIIEEVKKQAGGKITIKNILQYVSNFSDPELGDTDLVHKRWVLDRLEELAEGVTFIGSFDTLSDLEEVPNEDIPEGGFAFVGAGEIFQVYFWDENSPGWIADNNEVKVVNVNYNLLSGTGTEEQQIADWINGNLPMGYSARFSKINIVLQEETEESSEEPPVLKVKSGDLYTWLAASDPRNIANEGWEVPLQVDYYNLRQFLGGESVAGGKMKSVEPGKWNAPNTGATNETGFNGVPTGVRLNTSFDGMGISARLWCRDQHDVSFGRICALSNTSAALYTNSSYSKNFGLGIRLRKTGATDLANGESGAYTGNDGKVYRTICINGVEWLADNLCETEFRNGDPIPYVDSSGFWGYSAERCYYNDDEASAFELVSIPVFRTKRIYEFVNRPLGEYGLGANAVLSENLLMIYDGDVVGITPEQADAIEENSGKVGITQAQADAIEANSAKVGITPEQADAIIANSEKIGITPEQAAEIIDSANKKVVAVSVTGDANKTITLTREDGTILTASFLDIDTEDPDDVINTLTFNLGNGTLVAITSEGAVISVSLDGRYSLLGHTHTIANITGLQAIITALQDGLASHTHSASQITSGEFVADRLSKVSRYYKMDPQVPENGVSDAHLKMPSLSQMAIEKSYMGNKTMFQRPVSVEYSTDSGATWSDAGYTDTQLKDLVLGRYTGQALVFELSWTNVRLVWKKAHAYWTNGYVFFNYLYMYFNSGGTNEIIGIKIEKRDFSTATWSTHVEESKRIYGQPCHISFAHPELRFTDSAGRFDEVRIVLTLDNSLSSGKMMLHNLNWHGAYPANPQSDLYTWNRDKRVTFVGDVDSTGFRVGGNYTYHIGNHAHRTDSQNDTRYFLSTDGTDLENQVQTIEGQVENLEIEIETKVDDEDLQPVSPQFGVSVANQLVLVSKNVFLASTAIDVSFNLNYVIGAFQDPSTREDLSLNLVSAKPQNTCVVYSKSTTEPLILSDSKVLFPGDNYDTGVDKLNILTFRCLSPMHVFCENIVIDLPVVIPVISGYYGFTRNASGITVSFAGCPVGDLMLVSMANLSGVGGTGFAYTAPAGWDSIIEMTNGVDIWVRRRQIGDANSFVFSVPNLISGGGTIAMSIKDSNYVNGNPSLVLKGATVGELNALNKTLPAVSLPKMSLCLAVFGIASNNTTFTSFSAGWEEVAEDSRSGNRPLNIAQKTVDTSSGTAVTTQAEGQNGAGLIIAFHS